MVRVTGLVTPLTVKLASAATNLSPNRTSGSGLGR